jgi:TolB-like protein
MSLIAELKRRNVFRVGVAYAIVAWLLLEVASVIFPGLHLPDWTLTFLIIVILAGFPLALIVAWAFEMTPEGLKREVEVDRTESTTRTKGRKLDFAIIGLLAIALIFVVVENYVLKTEPESAESTAEAIPSSETEMQVKTIAVLPFANMSGDPEQEFFSDGISEELLNVLAKVKGLRVTSRTSAFAFKGTNTSVPEIAEKLGVDHVLEGSVRMAGDRVRITTQLIEVETDSHLWSESYDRDLADIFAVQDEIAAKVGEALKVALLGSDSRPIRPSAEISIEAYTNYLLALQRTSNPSVSALEDAERLLKSVIKREPDYAPAFVALASAYHMMEQYGMITLAEASAQMMPLIERALDLDDHLAGGWEYLGRLQGQAGNHEAARAAHERAQEIDPRNPIVLRAQNRYWRMSHEPERALAYADELLRIDPLSLINQYFLAITYLHLGRLSEMETVIGKMRSLGPESVAYLWGAYLLARSQGDLVTALERVEAEMRVDVLDRTLPSFIAVTYSDLGDLAAAKQWNDVGFQIDPTTVNVRLTKAILHLYQGEPTKAVAIARELASESDYTDDIRGAALRIAFAPDLAAGDFERIVVRYLEQYPVLKESRFPIGTHSSSNDVYEAFSVTLDLAAAYLHAGEQSKADSLLALVESELPHWPQIDPWGYGYANVELHALRGDKERALAALRDGVAKGIRWNWRFHLLHNPNLESIRDTPEFAAIIAEIEADMAEQLARVREMERNGELEPIPEVSATTQ